MENEKEITKEARLRYMTSPPMIHAFLQGAEYAQELVKNHIVLDIVVGSSQLKVGDKIKLPSGLEAEVIKTKIKVKDSFGGEYYLSDIEVG